MRIPNKSDIRRALTHARWLLSIKDPLNQQDRMLADLGFAYDALMQERDRLKQQLSDANAALSALNHAGNSVSFGGGCTSGTTPNVSTP